MQYKVIALSVHSDKLGKILNSGDIVSDDMFHEGHAAELVNGGFLEPVAVNKQGPLKPFDGTNDAPVEDPFQPESQDKPADAGLKQTKKK